MHLILLVLLVISCGHPINIWYHCRQGLIHDASQSDYGAEITPQEKLVPDLDSPSTAWTIDARLVKYIQIRFKAQGNISQYVIVQHFFFKFNFNMTTICPALCLYDMMCKILLYIMLLIFGPWISLKFLTMRQWKQFLYWSQWYWIKLIEILNFTSFAIEWAWLTLKEYANDRWKSHQ